MELSDGAKQALNRVVESSASTLADALDSSGKLVKDNVKELAGEVILFKGVIENSVSVAISGTSIGVLVAVMNWMSGLEGEGKYIVITMAGAVCFFLAIWFSCSVLEILKAKFAPRLFLTEYAANLLKKKSDK